MNEQNSIDFTSQPPPSGKGSTLSGGGKRIMALLTYTGLVPALYAEHAVQGQWIRINQYTRDEQLAAEGRLPQEGIEKGNLAASQPVGDEVVAGGGDDVSVISLKAQIELGALTADTPLYLWCELRQFQEGVASLADVGPGMAQGSQGGAGVGTRPAALVDLNVATTLRDFDNATKLHGGNPLEGYRTILSSPARSFGLDIDKLIASIETKALPDLNALLMAAIPGAKG